MHNSKSPHQKDGFFIPPYAEPLKGDENFFYATWKFMRNPIEGFGPLSYRQPITSVTTMKQRMHVITGPEGVSDVLTKYAKNFSKTHIETRIMGSATKEGLLLVHGEQWKKQRRAVAPMFAHRHMSDLAPLITEEISAYTATLGDSADVDLNIAMADLTFDILAKALLGDPQGLDREKLRKATRRVVTSAGTLRPDDMIPLPEGTPRPIGPLGVIALKRLKQAADKLIADRKDNPGDDLVGLLISAVDPKSGEPLTESERRDNLIGFFIAGHETTALTLTWALYLMGRDKTAQARLLEEVKSIRPDGDLQYGDMDKLPYTRAVLDETMRLFPPAPVFNRMCQESCEVLGREIKQGDVVLIAPYIMHRREALWDNPHAFDPDRFLRDPELRGKGSAFLPFGAGPRICVGMAFAMMEAVMALATLVRDFDVQVAEDCYPRPLMTVTLRPEGGIPARLVRRG